MTVRHRRRAASAPRLFVPGRIELLGKHTDYAGGSSLLVAVDRGFSFEAEPLDGDEVVVRAEATGEEARYRIRRERGGGGTGGPAGGAGVVVSALPAHAGRDAPGWARYADSVLQRVAADFGDALRGARVAFTSTLPAAAGLSSSSALVTGLFLGLEAACRFSELPAFRAGVPDAASLATWLAAAEMGGPVGTRGGSEDHTAILLARPGRVVRYAFAPVRPRGSAPLPGGWTFAVCASGVAADKGGAAQARYNRLSDLAADAVRAWAAGTRSAGTEAAAAPPHAPLHLDRARQESAADDAVLDAIRAGAPELGLDPSPLLRRARHFLEESALVDAAFDALAAGDLDAFAAAANRSAERGAALLDNQVPETLALAALARELGAPAASPFGGGFGGAVWALVREADAGRFVAAWEDRYRASFPQRGGAEFFTTPAGPPADGLPRFW
ncbi:MAG TPA: galactokinase family protein [Longimicrobiales bacterium]|nr:galactokinase family protein [Longimicrobiales bacterium]